MKTMTVWSVWPERREPGQTDVKALWEGLPGVEPPTDHVGDEWWDGRQLRLLTETGWEDIPAGLP